jgi:hypothetical protein
MPRSSYNDFQTPGSFPYWGTAFNFGEIFLFILPTGEYLIQYFKVPSLYPELIELALLSLVPCIAFKYYQEALATKDTKFKLLYISTPILIFLVVMSFNFIKFERQFSEKSETTLYPPITIDEKIKWLESELEMNHTLDNNDFKILSKAIDQIREER